MQTVVDYIQLIANLSALAVIGWIYLAYIKNLKGAVEAKDAQIQVTESSVAFWRDKAQALEKQTPEYVERVLADRIHIREEELKRLKQDSELHKAEIETRKRELAGLELELQKAKDFGRSIITWDPDLEKEVVVPTSELELVRLGEIGVDSAGLMIVDPVYIQTEWRQEDYDPPRTQFRDSETSQTYEMGVNFERYDTEVQGIELTPNQLIKSGRWQRIEPPIQPETFSMSYAGTVRARQNARGYGVLRFNKGHEGAGICIRTVYGDGMYAVYGDMHKGDIVRIYIDLQ